MQPIFTAHLFPRPEAKRIELLRSLTPEDWEKQTLAPKWQGKDVAAHLLDTQIRKVAAARRGYTAENAKKLPPSMLVTLINSRNAEGFRQYRQLNPNDLISKMEAASRARNTTRRLIRSVPPCFP
ncbi:MAG TPA: maleylpyruvate isomerase N-terminal domain-containing protein [Candidatus Acidoferrales bacterium]|nr:maleylpyruvate isomerase N-terminal domain-containing protein [Candidatus Acidoferrales bacterium]